MGIEELEKYVETLPPVIQHSNFYRDRVWADKSSLLYFVGKIKQQLKSSLPTQQDKVVVPEFVAEYLEMRKDQFQIGGLGVAIMHVFDGKESPKLFNWMNNNVEIFARAWLDGYTVEKEQLYYVILAEKKGDWKYTYWDSEGSVDFTNEKEDIQTFTEKQIKAIDGRYWAFAVPVEEDE